MKKLILLLLLSFFSVNAQQKKKPISEKQFVINKARTYFKEVYVPVHFKDPYSCKIQNIYAIEDRVKERMERLIAKTEAIVIYADTLSIDSKAKYNEALETTNFYKKKYNELTEKEKNEVVEYLVYIDAYGKNSFGNLVLGKYVLTMSKKGNIVEDVYILD